MTPSTLIVIIIAACAVLGLFSIFAGCYLVNRGHESGEVLIQGGGVAVISGLMAVLGSLVARHFNGGDK